MEDLENSQQVTMEQKSSIKVTRNSKGYVWEIKVYDENPEVALEKTIELEIKCQEKFGEKN